MAEEKPHYTIPQNLIDELKELAPYKEGKKCKTPEDYILNYFLIGRPATFFKNGSYQCMNSRKRSFIDLYFLTVAQFPEYEFEEFVKYIFSMLYKKLGNSDDIPVQMLCLYCPDVAKPVLSVSTSTNLPYGLNMSIVSARFGINLFNKTTVDGNPTLAELFAIAGVEKEHFVGKSFIED